MRNRFEIIVMIFLLIIAIILITPPPHNLQDNNSEFINNKDQFACEYDTVKYAHISYDDVYLVLKDLRDNENAYTSIFQSEILFRLKNLHETTGACITLYVYESAEDFSITEVSNKWKSEFKANSHWLKFGYHGISPDISKFDDTISLEEFIDSYSTVHDSILYFAGEESCSPWLRLSYFTATDAIVNYLYENAAVSVLLTADDERVSYNLNKNENEIVNINEILEKGGVIYLKTDIRYEKSEDIISDIIGNHSEDVIILFTHEWAFDETFADVAKSTYYLSKCGYTFL